MTSRFRFVALDPAPFAPLFALSDDALHALGARRMLVDETPGYPCRVSLTDAAVGETVVLLPWTHHDVRSPYRASGPIYVRAGAERAAPAVDEVPAFLRHRTLSLRAYDTTAMMVAADVEYGSELDAAIVRLLEDPRVAYIDIHNARPGCYNCRVRRG